LTRGLVVPRKLQQRSIDEKRKRNVNEKKEKSA